MEQKERKKRLKRRTIIWLVVLAAVLVAAAVIAVQANRILNQPAELFATQPPATTAVPLAVETADVGLTPEPEPTPEPLPGGIVNFLVLGVDGYSDSKFKQYSEDNHTDTMLVAAVNFDKNTVDLISIPRDTFTSVPGSTGYYKVNAAVNVGGGPDAANGAGYLKSCETVSRLLGGVPVDYYLALRFDTVVDLVDALGGIDYEVEGWFKEGGREYKKGMQHLNGQGVLDYLRVRKASRTNMPVGDANRVERQKRMLIAIYQKVKEQNLFSMIPTLLGTLDGVQTNVNASQILALANYAMSSVDRENIRMHALSGPSRRSEYTPWNFVFPDPEKRIELIRSVYGVTVQPDPYSSYVYLLWLEMYGFKAIHTMSVVDELMEKEAPDPAVMNEEAAAAFAQMQQAYAELSTACQAAALGLVEKPQLSTDSSRAPHALTSKLQKALKAFAKLYGYELPSLSVPDAWWTDTYINDVTVDFR